MRKYSLFLLILLTYIHNSFAQSQLDIDSDLSIHYTFNGTNLDQSGNGHHARMRGVTYGTDRFGFEGCAVEFDAIEDHIEIPNIRDLWEEGWTYSIWVKLDRVPYPGSLVDGSQDAFLFSYKDVIYGDDVYLYVDNSDSNVRAFFDDNESKIIARTPVEKDVWYHFVIVYGDRQTFLYVDGEEKGVVATRFVTEVYTNYMIGSNFKEDTVQGLPKSYGRIWGMVDDVRFYERALNGKEVALLYEQIETCGDVDEDRDGFFSADDCDDTDPEINPDAEEIINNEVDEDCDGEAVIIDEDMDGFHSGIDCDDGNPGVNPDQVEIPNNAEDEDCDGEAVIIDRDQDGYHSYEDCDDNNPNINPGQEEIPNNDIDENCDETIIIIDDDADGYHVEIDCDDNDPLRNPGQVEIPNNDIDEDCDGIALIIDEDMDGFNSDEDCDDNNPNINPGQTEMTGNRIDEDCDGFQPFYFVDVYPIPTVDYLKIINVYEHDLHCQIYAMDGKLIVDSHRNSREITVDMIYFPAGVYLLKIVADGEATFWELIEKVQE